MKRIMSLMLLSGTMFLSGYSSEFETYPEDGEYYVGSDWEAKKELIFKAEKHRKKAVEKAKHMENYFSYFPDLRDNQHMKELITGIITCKLIESPRNRILAVGVALIASLANDSYDKYVYARRTFCEITHHFEMHEFYSAIALTISDDDLKPLDYYEGYFYDAVDYLTLADILCICIDDDSAYYDCTDWICNHRTYVINAFEDKKLKHRVSNSTNTLINKVYDKIGRYYNSDHKSILYNLDCSFNALYKAEKGWEI